MVHRPVKLPSHLYLSPPSPPTYPYSPSTYLSLSPLTFTSTSPSALFRETSNSAIAVTHRIPGFRTSASASQLQPVYPTSTYTAQLKGPAAFLNSLRANLHLATSVDPFSPSPTSSTTHIPLIPSTPLDYLTDTPGPLRPISPPISMASPTTTSEQLSSPSPNRPATHPDALSTIPHITTSPATDATTKISALNLIADSVAQQRQVAATALIFHPLTLACYICVLAIVYQTFYKGQAGDLAIVLTTAAGVTMAGLLGVRWAVGGYLAVAEGVGTWKWLEAGGEGAGDGGEVVVLVTRFGEEVVGAVVLTALQDPDHPASNEKVKAGGGGGRKSQRSHTANANANAYVTGNTKTKGTIRAWTVRQKYRRKGVGGALLEEAVKLGREKGWSGPVFADDHANSARVLPELFNAGFEARERRARALLERLLHEEEVEEGISNGNGNGKGGKGRR